jgi:hypothetical protein
MKKLIIFIIGLHNKPQGCGASVASAAGPFTTKKRRLVEYISTTKVERGIFKNKFNQN